MILDIVKQKLYMEKKTFQLSALLLLHVLFFCGLNLQKIICSLVSAAVLETGETKEYPTLFWVIFVIDIAAKVS